MITSSPGYRSANSGIHITGDHLSMTTNAIQLELDPRELMGKKVGRLRRAGIVPVHLYGPGMEPRSLQCQASKLIRVLARAGGATPISITIQGESEAHLAFAREIQWDPRRDDLLHVDLLAADVSRPVTAQVPVILIGESSGARGVGGTVMQQLRTLDVQALPLEMPAQIEIDLEIMEESDSVIRVSDLTIPSAATVLTDSEELVARIELPRVAEEVAFGGEEGLEEGVEAESADAEETSEE
jgi:large subunit ribosomal protein L25